MADSNNVKNGESMDNVSYQGNYVSELVPAEIEAVKKGVLDGSIDLEKRASELGVDSGLLKNLISSDMTNLEKEQNPYLKSNLSGVDIDPATSDFTANKDTMRERIKYRDPATKKRFDDPGDSGSVTVAGCTITKKGFGDNRVCHSDYLGDFEYDPNVYAIGYIPIEEADGTQSQLPVLRYIGDVDGTSLISEGKIRNWVGNNTIPDGVKNLDYTFAGTGIIDVPEIPDSVESMHYAFAGCESLCGGNGGISSAGIILPDGLKDASGAFKGCKQLYPAAGNLVQQYGKTVLGGMTHPLTMIYGAASNVAMLARREGHGNLVGVRGKGDYDTTARFPSSLRNASEMFEGCDRIDGWSEKVNLWQPKGFSIEGLGGEYTPYLSTATAKDMFSHIDSSDQLVNGVDAYVEQHGASIEDIYGSTEYLINRDGTADEDKKASVSGKSEGAKNAFAEAQAATAVIHAGEQIVKPVRTNAELDSKGNKLIAWEKDESGNWYNDVSAKKETIPTNIEGYGLEKMGTYGLVGTGIFAATSLITRSRIVGAIAGIGGTFLLSKSGVISGAFSPIVKFTANLLPEGSVKTALLNFAEKLPSAQLEKARQDAIEWNGQWDDNHAIAAEWQDERMGKEGNFADLNDLTYMKSVMMSSMKENGKACAQTLTLQATYAEGDRGMDPVTDVISATVKSREAEWNEAIQSNGGQVSDEMKKEMRKYYLDITDALKSYGEGAKDGIESKFEKGSADYESSYAGLAMADKAYMASVINSLNAMESRYHFMDETTWQKIRTADIYGITCANPETGVVYNTDGLAIFNKATEAIKKESEKIEASSKSMSSAYSEAEADTGDKESSGSESKADKADRRAAEAAAEGVSSGDSVEAEETERDAADTEDYAEAVAT